MERTHKESQVLFQKLGNAWYVFTEVNDDIIYSALPAGMDPRETDMERYEVIEEHLNKISLEQRRSPEPSL